MTEFTKADAAAEVRRLGVERRDQPFRIVSGWSRYYVDSKHAVARGGVLLGMSRLVIAVAEQELGVTFTVVGGPTMGADPLSHGIAAEKNCRWFSVRKEPLVGTPESEWLAGTRFGVEPEGDNVLWVEDAVSTGQSWGTAMDRFLADPSTANTRIVGAVAMVDRGDEVAGRMAARGIPYAAVLSYRDLGIPALGTEN